MRAGHVLLVFLILAALASHAYVALNWDYRDAPGDVRLALGVGFAVAAILAILLGPRVLGGARRGPVPVPV